jgi:lipoate-protein ligase A
MQKEADKAKNLSDEFKMILRELTKDKIKNKDKIASIKEKMNELNMNLKQLDINSVENLEALVEFAKE